MALADRRRHLNPPSQAVVFEEWFQKWYLFTDLPAGLVPVTKLLLAAKIHSDWMEKTKKAKKKGNSKKKKKLGGDSATTSVIREP